MLRQGRRELLANNSWYKKRDPESRTMSPWDRKGGDEEEETRSYIKETSKKMAVPLTSVLFVEQRPGGV